MATWFFAASPIRRSVSVKATNDGVVRLPWSLAMISQLRKTSCQHPVSRGGLSQLSQDCNLPILAEDTDARVGRAQVDTDGGGHLV
jgi:hypothetical protein